MKNCTFDPVTLRCESCGYQATSLPTFRECRPPPVEPWRPVMVGDLVEKALSSVGLTKARVEKALGKPCRCGQRQEGLNKLGIDLQVRGRKALQALQRFVLPD